MDRETLEAQPRTAELMQVLLDLSLVSHVRGVSYDSNTNGGKASTSPPTGGIDQKGDREDGYRQKSADHFALRLDGLFRGAHKCSRERAEQLRDGILKSARDALRDWQRTPDVPGVEPAHGTLAWKCKIANDPRPSRTVAGHYGTSHVSVLRYRREYAGVRVE